MLKRKCHEERARSSYHMHDGCSARRLDLSGFLSAELATEIEACWRTASSTLGCRALVIDVSRMTDAGESGHRLLRQWYQLGAQFVASSSNADTLIESITGHPPHRVSAFPSGRSALPLGVGAKCALVALPLLLFIKFAAPGASGSQGTGKVDLARTPYAGIKSRSSSFVPCPQIAASAPTEAKR